MKPFLAPLALALLAGAPLRAQAPADTEKRIQDLERKLEILSKELEQQKTGSTPPVAGGGGGSYGLGAAASKVYEAPAGLSVGGYGEFVYQNFSKKLQDGTPSPQADRADTLRGVFYFGYKFSDRIVFNSEVEFEHSGFGDEHPEGESILEFAYLDFLISKSFNVRAGQLLLPLGFVNELHEPPAVLSALRPMVEREGGILPTTWHENGVGIHGDLPGNLRYRLYAVEGLNAAKFEAGGLSGGRQDGNQAVADRFALTGRLDWTPMPGSLLGFSFYRGSSAYADKEQPVTRSIPTSLGEFHAEYRGRGLQLRGLIARTTLERAGVEALGAADPAYQVGLRQFGGYLEAGYDLLSQTGSRQALIPFLRWERMNLQQDVAAGATADPANDLSVLTGGLSYKPIPQVAVKLDYSRIRNGAGTGRNQFNVALGYEF